MTMITAFDYPTQQHVRRHGPIGYSDYESFRDWLRDEFDFRCVFCLRREKWCDRQASFHIDHWVPQTINPNLRTEYNNLLYVCARCNSKKGDLFVPSPCESAFGNCVVVFPDGTIESRNDTGELLIDLFRLDDAPQTQYRKLLLTTWRALISSGQLETYADWMRYPEDLPDLGGKRTKSNRRPEGILQSAFERRKRGALPEIY
jgi:hypothetical protein